VQRPYDVVRDVSVRRCENTRARRSWASVRYVPRSRSSCVDDSSRQSTVVAPVGLAWANTARQGSAPPPARSRASSTRCGRWTAGHKHKIAKTTPCTVEKPTGLQQSYRAGSGHEEQNATSSGGGPNLISSWR
jgi:hypothetical protein